MFDCIAITREQAYGTRVYTGKVNSGELNAMMAGGMGPEETSYADFSESDKSSG